MLIPALSRLARRWQLALNQLAQDVWALFAGGLIGRDRQHEISFRTQEWEQCPWISHADLLDIRRVEFAFATDCSPIVETPRKQRRRSPR